jgi:hypothetical protein
MKQNKDSQLNKIKKPLNYEKVEKNKENAG